MPWEEQRGKSRVPREKIPGREKKHKSYLFRAATLTTLRWLRQGAGKDRACLESWTRMFEPNWEAIAEEQALGRTELRILLLATAHLGADNKLMLSQRDMATKLGITPSVISRAMQVLVRGGLVFQDGQRYWLNSRLVARQSVGGVIRLREVELAELRALEGES